MSERKTPWTQDSWGYWPAAHGNPDMVVANGATVAKAEPRRVRVYLGGGPSQQCATEIDALIARIGAP